VLMRAVVRDLCSRVEGARVLSFVGMGMGMVPLFVPALNAWVGVVLGWRATLAVFIVYLALTLAMVLGWYRETLAVRDPRALSPGDLRRAVRAVLGHRQALGYILCCVFAYAGLAVWISAAPHLVLGYFGQPAARFGLWWAIPVATYVLGGYLSALGMRRYSSDTILAAGAALLLAAGAALVLLLRTTPVQLVAFVAACGVYNAGFAIVQPHAQAGALSFFPELAGRVSAVLGFLQMLGGAAVGIVFGALHDGTPRAAAYLIAGAALATTVARVTLTSWPSPSRSSDR
jgi:DHA1 family bicyclomycin/chloramphenicol resistance-like MFS transporter